MIVFAWWRWDISIDVDVAIRSVIGCSGDTWGKLKVCFPKFKITAIAEPAFSIFFPLHVCGTFFSCVYVFCMYKYIYTYIHCECYHITIFVFPVFLGSLFVLAAKKARILGAEATPNRSEWQDIGQAWLVQVDAHTGLVLQFRRSEILWKFHWTEYYSALSDARSLKV